MQKRPLEADRCALANAGSSVFFLIDVQEKLLPAILRGSGVVEACQFLLNSCELFGVPTVVSEQYPRGLGGTVSALSTHPVMLYRIEKLRFSAAQDLLALLHPNTEEHSEIMHVARPTLVGRSQVVIAGIEAHICVMQTALELRAAGLQVFVCQDATGSRTETDRDLAFRRMEQAGCIITSAESIAFEWCRAAGSDSFKKLSQLVKSRSL